MPTTYLSNYRHRHRHRHYPRHPAAVNIITTFAYLPTCLLYVVPMAKYRPDVITPEARAVPQRVWLIMGTLDSIAGVMQSCATAKMSSAGALVVLLMQSAIPSSMIITKVFLKSRYKVYQYCGAVLVIAGILVVLVPQLVQGVSGVDDLGAWAAVLVLSCIPMCLSSVYKEKALGDTGKSRHACQAGGRTAMRCDAPR